MTKEEKQLLLITLCEMMPYGVKIELTWWVMGEGTYINTTLEPDHIEQLLNDEDGDTEIKPYLRPMSSMTEEEKMELLHTIVGKDAIKYFQVLSDGSIDNTDAAHQDLNNFTMHWINFDAFNTTSYIDWLNKNHFNYRNLPEHLYIKVTKENNPYKIDNL